MEEEPASPRQPTVIGTGRLEAFSDAVLAVIITIMVLGLAPPPGDDIDALKSLGSKFLIYVLSFTFIGIYWNNHHHLLRVTRRISGSVMWANLHLLFWLSLVPVSTAWAGDHPLAPWPAAMYGFIGFMAGVAYSILTGTIINANKGTDIERAIGSDLKGKVSLAIYALGILFASASRLIPFSPILSYIAYASVSVMWFVPDRRLESDRPTTPAGVEQRTGRSAADDKPRR
ncbi:MAG TPA: TMEM175 family protein [Ktedonobacterales bacterium]|nr:TMEM175 family protein [Ktedonobacterales bacterium]